MDKETLSNYGWIVICVMVLAVMIALATPFGSFVSDAVKSTTQGLFDVNQGALNSTGLINIDGQEFESCEHDYEVTTTANCTTAGTTTRTCKLCGKSYSEETPAGHKYDDTGLKCTECDVTVVEYSFTPSDYDAKMGTTTATDTNVVIPETFEYNGKTYKVTTIGNDAFYCCTNLKSINIPKSITTIGQYAFAYCESLTSIDLSNTKITTIGNDAFSSCASLESITLPASVEAIGATAFTGCESLTSVTLPEGITSIEFGVFQNCHKLTSINIPDSVTNIGDAAFLNCYSLKNIDLPNGLTSIGDSAFYGCTSLSSITFEGTRAQWNAITFGDYWNYKVPATVVHCSDGDVTL